ncbi:MAG: lysylphosphatidylglycerol synthase transmembrane domain-containing protein [Pseudomonadota bacterium]
MRLLGLLLFAFVLMHVDLDHTLGLLRQVRYPYVLGAALLTLPMVWLKSWRWRLLLSGLGITISGFRCFKLYLIGMFAGHVTPGQLGEVVKAAYLRDDGHPFGAAIMTVVLDRIADLALLVVLTVPGLLLLKSLHAGRSAFLGVLATGCLLISRPVRGMASEAGRGAWEAIRRWLQARSGAALPEWPAAGLGRLALGQVLLLTCGAYAVTCLRYLLLLLALGVTMPVVYLVFGMAVMGVATMLPFSVAGIGTRDATLLLVFGAAGLGSGAALGFSMLVLSMVLLQSAMGCAAWVCARR